MTTSQKFGPFIWLFLLFSCEAGLVYFSGVKFTSTNLWYLVGPNLVILALLALIDDIKLLTLIVCIVPFHVALFSFEVGIITFNIYTLGIVVLTVFALAKIAVGASGRYHFNQLDMVILSMSLMYFFTTIFANDLVTTGFLAFNAIFIPVLSYFVLKVRIQSIEQYTTLLVLLVASTIVFAVFGVAEHVKTGQRIESLMGTPIGAGTILMYASVVLLFVKHKWWVITLPFLGIVVAALIWTYSRAYLVVLLLSPVLYWLISRKKASLIFIMVVVASMLLTYASLMMHAVSSAHDEKFRQESESAARVTDTGQYTASAARRAAAWRLGLEVFYENPVIGAGLHGISAQRRVGYHNNLVEWLAYGGVLGFLLHILLLGNQFRRFDKLKARNPYIAVNLLVLLAILINGFANGLTHGVMPLITYLILGMNEALFKIELVEGGNGRKEASGAISSVRLGIKYMRG